MLTTGKTLNSGTSEVVSAPQAGQSFQPVRLPPGTRLDVGYQRTSHAIVSFPGIGGCMITEGSSLRLPESSETDMTVTFDRHISSPNLMMLNISATEMAKHGGAAFRTKNKFKGNSAGGATNPNVVVTTIGGRLFILDQQTIHTEAGAGEGVSACTVGAFDGTATVEELTSGQKALLKAGQVLVITLKGVGQPRQPTKAELSYDLGCKLAVLGREVPARLPPNMKTTAPTSRPGTKVNSLGMVFVPVPGSKVLMCVHETRGQDLMAYEASVPPPSAKTPLGSINCGLWGWEDHPVTASWDKAHAFCEWLSKKEGKKYRLPTDEEWSQAVGINTQEKRKPGTTPAELTKQESAGFPWGDEWPPLPGYANVGDMSYFAKSSQYYDAELMTYDDGFADTAPVMSYKPNKLGIYDLAGNVSEWCEDWFNETHTFRTVRGSDWKSSHKNEIKSSYRSAVMPEMAAVAGFRVVLETP